MANNNEVKIVVKAVDNISTVLSGIGLNFAYFSAGAVIALSAISSAAFEVGNDVTEAFNTLIIKTGETGEPLENMKDDLRAVFRNVPQDVDEVASVLAELRVRLGITGNELQDTSKTVLDFSRITGIDATEAAQRTAQMLNLLGLEAGDAETLLNKLTKASQTSGIDIRKLSGWILDAGTNFGEIGFDLDRTIALFGQFEQAGADPIQVLSSMRMTLNNIADDGFNNAEEGFNSYIERIKEAPNILEAVTISNELFGRMFGGKIADDIRAGRFEVDDYVKVIQDSDGVVSNAANETLTWSDKFDILKNRSKSALEPLGLLLVDGANAMLDTALPAVDRLSLGFTEMSEDFFEAAGNNEFLQSVMQKLSDLWNDISAQVMPVLMEQFGKFSDWYTENQPLIEKFGDSFLLVMDILSEAVSTAIAIALPLLDGLIDVILQIGTLIMQVASGDWAGAWETIKSILNTALTAIDSAIFAALDRIAGWFGGSLEEIKTIWSDNFRQLGEIVSVIMYVIGQKIKQKIDEIKSVFSGLMEKIEEIKSAFSNGITGAIDSVVGAFDRMKSAVSGFSLPAVLTPGSPTPFELGLRGINKAMTELNKNAMPDFADNLSFGGVSFDGASSRSAVVGASKQAAAPTIVINYSPTYSSASPEEMLAFVPVVEAALRQTRGFANG